MFKLISQNNGIRFETVEVECGYACYVSGEGKLTYRPELADTSDYLAIENHSPYWCRPFWGSSLSALPQRTQALLIRNGEIYTYLLPICDNIYKTLISGVESGIEFHTFSNLAGTVCDRQIAFICTEGKEPFAVMKAAARAACKLLDNGLKLREEKCVPEVFNYLGWCSWDALQIRVSHAGLMEKVREFKEKKTPIHFAIIDDMWADVPALNDVPEGIAFMDMVRVMHASPLRSFDGDPKRFPNGMKAAIDDMKKAGIAEVGVWFPTTGYWAGLDPNGSEAERQKENTVTLTNGQIIVAPETEKAGRYFDGFCERIKEWGGDFVKIDNQGFHQRYAGVAPVGESARAIQKGIDAAADKYFGGALINCMGMPNECMFNRTSAVSRCSDDFMPESREWFAKNILQCSYNGLLQGQFYVNDWDMWWTDDEQAVKNSLCRAISGGPVYVSDKIGRTRAEILKPLCLEDGRIIRPDESATPTADCLMADPTKTERIFKIRNRLGSCGVCAVFNINAEKKAVSGTLIPTETGVAEGDNVYYEHFTQATGVLKNGEGIDISLG
ncbi:MAG: hypothetical protein IJY04_10035, partial [Clostridia bacterium]|nr:hypothetical protein [Clostridia bacterium]